MSGVGGRGSSRVCFWLGAREAAAGGGGRRSNPTQQQHAHQPNPPSQNPPNTSTHQRDRLINDFVWTNVPAARTDALDYHHPTWEDLRYDAYKEQLAAEAAAAA